MVWAAALVAIFTTLAFVVPILIVPPLPLPFGAPASIVMLPPLPFVPPPPPPCSTRSPPASALPPLPAAPAVTVRDLPAMPAPAVDTEIVWLAFDPKAISPLLLSVKASVPPACRRMKLPPVPVLLILILFVLLPASVCNPCASWTYWALVSPPSCPAFKA